MTIYEIKEFALSNNLDATDLLLAADAITKDKLIAKLQERGGRCDFPLVNLNGEAQEVPYVICTCFDQACEMRVDSVLFDDNGDVELHSIDETNEGNYILGLTDIAFGQSRFIVEEM